MFSKWVLDYMTGTNGEMGIQPFHSSASILQEINNFTNLLEKMSCWENLQENIWFSNCCTSFLPGGIFVEKNAGIVVKNAETFHRKAATPFSDAYGNGGDILYDLCFLAANFARFTVLAAKILIFTAIKGICTNKIEPYTHSNLPHPTCTQLLMQVCLLSLSAMIFFVNLNQIQ